MQSQLLYLVNKENIHIVECSKGGYSACFIPFQREQVYTFLYYLFFTNKTSHRVILGCPEDIARYEGQVGWISKEI